MTRDRKEYMRLYRAANRERRAEYNRQWADQNPGRLEEWRAAHKEQKRSYDKAYREINRAKRSEQIAAWVAENPERVKQTRRAWRQRKREDIRDYCRLWHAQHPEASLQYQRRYLRTEAGKACAVRSAAKRRANLLKAGNTITTSELKFLKAFSSKTCAYCLQVNNKLELEHCTPLSRGGEHSLDNLVYACRSCNRKKHSKTVLEFCLGFTT